MWPTEFGEPDEADATTMTSGTSHKSIAPSPLSSVMFATSGATIEYNSGDGPAHVHWISGSKLFGGAVEVHMPTRMTSGCTLHWWNGGAPPTTTPTPLGSGPGA